MQHTPSPTRRTMSSGTGRLADVQQPRPYIISNEIGKGSFATVYKGYHEETRNNVAIKAVVTDNLSQKLFENLQSEIQILKSLSHRHITKLIDIVRADRNVYLIMEFCSGGDLTNYIKKRGRVESLEYVPLNSSTGAPQYYPHPRTGGLDEIVVRSFLRQLARALKFLRHRNLIHRDIKPQNLLLNPASPEELARGHPLGVPILKVADFGFARSLPQAQMADTLCGSPLYMAPEILRYQKYDAKADLWSVGAVLYEMAVGKAPFRARNHIDLLANIEKSKGIKFPDEEPTSGAGSGSGSGSKTHGTGGGGGGSQELPVPEDIKQLIRSLLKRQPAERASFEEFFNSTALAKSKFPRPREPPNQNQNIGVDVGRTIGSTSTLNTRKISGSKSGSGSDKGKGVVLGAGVGAGMGMGMGIGKGVVEVGVEDGRPWSPGGRQAIPEQHKNNPLTEVDDPKAMIPPSKFNFRRTSESSQQRPLLLQQLHHQQQQQQQQMQQEVERSPRLGNASLPRVNTGNGNGLGLISRERSKMGQAHQMQPQPQSPPPRQDITFPIIGMPKSRSGRPLSTEGSFIPGETEEDGMLRKEYVLVDDTRAVEFNRAVDELSAYPRRPLHDRRMPPTPSTDEYPPEGNNINITFPPVPNSNNGQFLSSSPSSIASRAASNALHRALNLASKKLFGTSNRHSKSHSQSHSQLQSSLSRDNSSTSSPRRLIIGLDMEGGGGGGGLRDPMEDDLLLKLEEVAQKTDVLTNWADEIYDFVKAVPQKPLPDPTKFAKREGESEAIANTRKYVDEQTEHNASTCIAVYMHVMEFAQRGIDMLKEFKEHMEMKYPDGDYVISDGFHDALKWFKELFAKCNSRASLVKTWLPTQYNGPKAWLDHLLYDRALQLSRSAARMELLDQASTPDECEKLYEESLWCLYALQDGLLYTSQNGNPYMVDDRKTIEDWIQRTKTRLLKCKARRAMTDKERLNDVRVDRELTERY